MDIETACNISAPFVPTTLLETEALRYAVSRGAFPVRSRVQVLATLKYLAEAYNSRLWWATETGPGALDGLTAATRRVGYWTDTLTKALK